MNPALTKRVLLDVFEKIFKEKDPDNVRGGALILAGSSVIISCFLTALLIGEHLITYRKPEEQKWIIGCIFMVPLYSVCSFLSLWKPQLDTITNLIRNCYEAYTLYSFCMFLIACLGGEDRTIEKLSGRSAVAGTTSPLLEEMKSKRPPGYSRITEEIHHPIPMNFFLKPWIPGPEFYVTIKFGLVQYMVLKTSCAVLQLVLDPWRLYGEGDFEWTTVYPYMTFVLSFSQCWAIYCLVMFYQATWQYLVPIKPLGKFISIKAIIFVTWWQGVIIAAAFAFGLLKPPPDDITEGVLFQNALQDFLVALEMSVAAVAHMHCFTVAPYCNTAKADQGLDIHHVAVLDNMASMDVPVDPEEVIASEDAAIQRFVPAAPLRDTHTSFADSIHDVLFGGGKEIVTDVQQTMHVAVEPFNRSFLSTLDLISGGGFGLSKSGQHLNGNVLEGDRTILIDADSISAVGSSSSSVLPQARRKKSSYSSIGSFIDRHTKKVQDL